MSSTITENPAIAIDGMSDKRRDLPTQIFHADEEAYAKELEPFGGKEDMTKGGDVYYPNPPKMAVDIIVGDLTGREHNFTLEKNGFCLAKQETKVIMTTEDLQDARKIKEEYYPEMQAWLKELTGAPIVKVMHHGSRVSTSLHGANSIKKEEVGQVTRPGPAVFGAHLDQSTWQGFNVIHKYFPDECEALLHGRYLVVRANRWLTEIRESMGIRPNPTVHKWYYKFAQTANEVLVFKQFDNFGDARACPHSAFIDPEYEDAEPRESIEVRAILLWPDEKPTILG
ncbi:hypothetical protein N7462_009007 [Penicillium macrosclerotiorum]|uniref:uncharacterized protein n=1 Tax=Penicillium macrosclerotiorum TaxID=303699 RepID=UPI0025469B4A|nr:uncharacterized protein N7462_009007 [Penicillium macrosclerotiorum]KAJ5676110.1 hypothetical protein N7462_009007 [Penicillium macrosclerotiorum]